MDGAEAVARRLQLALTRPFGIAGQEIPLSAAIGISIHPLDASGTDALMNNADAAMHHAKRAHQGGLEFFKKSISTRAAKRLSLEADLRKALERQEFTLNYQPRLALKTLKVEAVEALLRWTHPQRGMVPPDEFIPVAEQSGLIVEIGDWVLREACAQVRRWRADDTSGWQVAVNVSGVQFRDGTLVRRVTDAIASAGIDSRMIELEFTEGALIEYSTAVSKAVKSLKELGVATALDDFGTGYSSMSYLRHFPVDTLKIDRVFVRDIASRSSGNAPLVDAIIAMARSLGLATVAEGVETEAQWQYLKDREATQVQGFLFCRPLSIPDLERWHSDWLLSSRQTGTGVRPDGEPAGAPDGRRSHSHQRRCRQSTSLPDSSRASTRAMTNKRSERRFRYLSASGAISSTRARDQQRRSARRHTARATWQAAAAAPPPGKMKSLSGGKRIVEPVEFGLQPVHVGGGHHAMPGNAQLPAEIEQIVLHLGQAAAHGLRKRRDGEHHADRAVGLIDAAVSLDAQTLLGDARAVAQAGAAVVAGPGIDLAQAVAHDAPFPLECGRVRVRR